MPVGVLRQQGAQLRQIIARERAALEADRFHCPQLLCHPGPRVRQKMSKLQPSPRLRGEGWSLDILEGPTWAKGRRFYQAAAAWTMVRQVAGALAVAKVIGLSASCLRSSVTKSRHEGRLAPRRHLGKGA